MHLFRRCIVLALALTLAGAPDSSAADVPVGEAAVGIAGSSLMELNPDAAGTLFASDYTAPAILKVTPASGAYTRYVLKQDAAFLIQPGDAKPDAQGSLWWSDYSTAFGKVTPASLRAEYWDLAARGLNPGGFAFDPAGGIWITQPNQGQLIHFTPSDRNLCLFAVGGGGDYIVSRGAQLWLADRQAGRLLRFDTSNNQLTAWTLPAGWATPEGVTVDGDGRVWWADSGSGLVGRLTPGANQAVVVTLPAPSQPVMLAAGTEVMWFSDGGGLAGFVDPALAGGTVHTLTPTVSTVGPTDCQTLAAGTVQTGVTQYVGTATFAAVTWTPAAGQAGVTRYALPRTGITPLPWGIAAGQGRVWLVDQNRNVLARTPRLPQSPALSIGLEAGGNRLTWGAVTKDEGGEAVAVASYQVWRGGQPYFRPWDAGVVLAATTGGTNVLDSTLAAPGAPVFYGARSVGQSGLQSKTSARGRIRVYVSALEAATNCTNDTKSPNGSYSSRNS